ncbi:MAG: radical SAM protein [Desulfobulbaceae bacterium]|nr:radical SAM protein [Desulfobulbaceae bacterium]
MTIIPFPDTPKGCNCRAPVWLTLAAAPQAAARSRFCKEDKPLPAAPFYEALAGIADLEARGNSVAGLDLNGPGDPLATWSMTEDILTLLRKKYPDLPVGLTTLGLGLAEHAAQMAEYGVSRVTLLMDAVDPQTVRKLYTWIRPGKRNTPLARAADILVDEQARGIAACRAAGISVSIRTTVYGGVNDNEVEEISCRASGLGAESITLLPGKALLKGEEQVHRSPAEVMATLAKKAGRHFKAVSLETAADRDDVIPLASQGAMPRPTGARPNVAVLSANGMDIDLHLGQAIKALIYGPREDGLPCLLQARDLPEPGTGDNRWQQVAAILDDCFALLAGHAGNKPQEILGRHGLPLLLMEDNVEGTVDALYGGGRKGKRKR